MKRYRLSSTGVLVLEQGDITLLAVDAIVNAANPRMLGGGGVDGAIHRAAGPELRAACEEVPEIEPGVRCPTGAARITPGFRLPARYVIHTVGPVYRSAAHSAPLLRAAYRASLALAVSHSLATIAFPAISCGVYGYPLDEAAAVAIDCCREYGRGLALIHFALVGDPASVAWQRAADALLEQVTP
jgi:O-acetyl-ADP-ribose deacetylase (regulator of RNase III)